MQRPALVLACLATAAVTWCVPRSAPPLRADLELVGHGAGTIELALRVRGARGPLVLEAEGSAGAARVELLGASAGDRSLPWRELGPGRFAVDAAPRELVVRYRVEPTPGLAPDTLAEPCATGRADGDAIALSLASVLLLPRPCPAEVRLRLPPPPGWHAVRAVPERLAPAGGESPWRLAWVAWRSPPVEHALGSGVRLVRPSGRGAGLVEPVRELAAELEAWLGPPRAAVDVVLLPRAEGGPRVCLPADVDWVALDDVESWDGTTARRLLRRLVPAWLGRRPAEALTSVDPRHWALAGVAEWLAHRLPGDLAWTERDARADLQATWMRSPELRRVDLGAAPEGASRSAALERRLAAAVLVATAVDELGESGARAWLHGWDGIARPPAPPGEPGEGVASCLPRPLARLARAPREPLPFERAWTVRLAPPERPAETAAETVLEIVFAHGSGGDPRGCACESAPAGSIACRTAWLRERRARGRGVALFDLGGFAPVDPRRRDPTEAAQHAFAWTLRFHGEGYLEVDAATLGADELYCGLPELYCGLPIGFPLVAAGLEVGGSPVSPYTVVERAGVRIAYVGYSELPDAGLARELHEPHLAGVRFPDDPAAAEEAVHLARAESDLVVVGGELRTPSLVRLAGSGADVILAAGHHPGGPITGGPLGRLGDALVALDTVGDRGLNRLTLGLSATGEIVRCTYEAVPLPAGSPAAPDVVEIVAALPPRDALRAR